MERILKEKLKGGKFKNVNRKHRKIMQNVKGKGNRTTEKRFRAALIRTGISGWKLNYKRIKGSPDIYFPEYKIAIFLDGCFWHGCDKCGHIPKKNSAFWKAKINRNKERDILTAEYLKNDGVLVKRFWEHEITNSLKKCINELNDLLSSKRGK